MWYVLFSGRYFDHRVGPFEEEEANALIERLIICRYAFNIKKAYRGENPPMSEELEELQETLAPLGY